MECYYHPEREGTDQCAICGKNICKECGLEIAGKIYCKECLEKIVGLGIENKAQEEVKPIVAKEPIMTEPAKAETAEDIYQPKQEADSEIPYARQEESVPDEITKISEDSPYKIRDNADTYAQEPEISYQKPKVEETPQDDFIYPDHSYEPEVTSARQDLEDKYEKYLDDLYFDENEVPLNEQLAKDEAQYGSLTRKEYKPKEEIEEPVKEEEPARKKLLRRKKDPMDETPEEMEKRIREEILKEQELMGGKEEKNIHNLKDEKEPMGIVDILLTIILIIVILVVIYYIIYLLFLSASYPTFIDSIYALSNPQNVINNILSSS